MGEPEPEARVYRRNPTGGCPSGVGKMHALRPRPAGGA